VSAPDEERLVARPHGPYAVHGASALLVAVPVVWGVALAQWGELAGGPAWLVAGAALAIGLVLSALVVRAPVVLARGHVARPSRSCCGGGLGSCLGCAPAISR
jgi:hypothetical protein